MSLDPFKEAYLIYRALLVFFYSLLKSITSIDLPSRQYLFPCDTISKRVKLFLIMRSESTMYAYLKNQGLIIRSFYRVAFSRETYRPVVQCSLL